MKRKGIILAGGAGTFPHREAAGNHPGDFHVEADHSGGVGGIGLDVGRTALGIARPPENGGIGRQDGRAEKNGQRRRPPDLQQRPL